jgi:formate dehydrogenase assembly factor FdhD
LVAARGAPTTVSVELARHAKVTLVGFLRETRANVYAGPWRVREI